MRQHTGTFTTIAALAACLAAATPVGCSSCEESAVATDAAAAVDLGPVPAPAGLGAELFVPKPQATWTALRELVGGPGVLLPGSFPLLVATLLGLGPEAAGTIDGDAMLVGALLQTSDVTGIEPVVGVRVHNGRSLVAALTTGQSGRFVAERDQKSGLLLLVPKAGKTSDEMALAILGDHLLIASTRATLLAGGPYVGRTLPKRPSPPEPIVLASRGPMLRGAISSTIKRVWRVEEESLRKRARGAEQQYGGRPPDFGDPQAIVSGLSATVASSVALVESLAEARLVVVPRADRLDAQLAVRGEPGGAASELLAKAVSGDLNALLRLPASSVLALLLRSAAASREESGRAIALGLSNVLGERLAKAEQARLEAAMLALARGRGDEASFALTGAGLVMRIAVADQAELERGINGALAVLDVRALKNPIEGVLGPFTITRTQTRIAGLQGPAGRASFVTRPRGLQGHGSRTLELLWVFHEGSLFSVVSFDAKSAMGDLVRAASGAEGSLGNDVHLRDAAMRVGADASFGALLDPTVLSARAGAEAGTGYVVVAGGAKSDRGVLRAEISKSAIQVLARSAM